MGKKCRALFLTLLCMLLMAALSGPAMAADRVWTVNAVGVSGTYDQDSARSMLSMINNFRTGSDAWAYDQSGNKVSYSGLGTLTYDYGLEEVAMQRAMELAVVYGHTRPFPRWDTFSTIMASYSGGYMGENIAAGYGSAASVFSAWQETNENYDGQGHRRNMLLSAFRSVGIGHVVVDGVHFWVQEFASVVRDTTPRTITAKQTRTVIILSDAITSKSLYFTSDPVKSMEEGTQADAPEVMAKIKVRIDAENSTWGSVNVIPGAVLTSSNTNVADIEDGKIIAKSPGTTTITGTAMGTTVSYTLTVTKHQISRADMTLSSTTFAYDGTAKEPAVTVRYEGNTLARGTDYELAYTANTNAGTGTVRITGTGDYEGTVNKTFTITPVSLAGARFSVADQTYTGSALQPAPGQVTLNGVSLRAGTDYTLSYQNNTNAGTATAAVTGKGNYTGTATTAFAIKAANISKYSVTAAAVTATGKALTPAVTVKSPSGRTLKEGTDYQVASYKNNVKAGTATVTVTGRGNYTGTATGHFTIKKAGTTATGKLGTASALVTKASKIKNEKDMAGSTFAALQLKYTRAANNSIGLSWKKVQGAARYIVLGNRCNAGYKKLKETTARSYTQYGLKKGTYYKYFVAAVDSTGNVIAISKSVHAATTGGKTGNDQKVGLNRTALTLSRGKTFTLKAVATPVSKSLKVQQHRKISYESTNTKVATVTAAGRIKAIRKGTCYIYAYAQDGVYKAVKVTVK